MTQDEKEKAKVYNEDIKVYPNKTMCKRQQEKLEYMNHPLGVLDEDYAWAIYNFVNEWKSGKYGEIALQKAIKDNFKF